MWWRHATGDDVTWRYRQRQSCPVEVTADVADQFDQQNTDQTSMTLAAYHDDDDD